MKFWIGGFEPILHYSRTPSRRLVSGLASYVFFALGPNGSG